MANALLPDQPKMMLAFLSKCLERNVVHQEFAEREKDAIATCHIALE
jgi:hypothetical protein